MVELKFIEVKQITQRYIYIYTHIYIYIYICVCVCVCVYIYILFSNKAIKLVFKPRWIYRYIQTGFLYNPSMEYFLKKVKMTYVYNYG